METRREPPKASFTKFWRKFRFLSKSRNRPFKLTSAGWVFILYAIGVGAGAINTGNNLLYLVFGVFMGLLLASGVLSDLSLWGLSVDLVFPGPSHAGQVAYFTLRLENTKKWVPSLSVVVLVEGTVGGEKVILRVHIPSISAQQTEIRHLSFTPPCRGYFDVTSVKFETHFPFGLLRKWWNAYHEEKPGGFFVYPKIGALDLNALERLAQENRGDRQSARIGDGVTVVGARDFRAGDNAKRIYWKASAKRDSLFLRETELDEAERWSFLWPDAAALRTLPPEDTERFVSFVTTVFVAARQLGRDARLFTSVGTSAAQAAEIEPVLEFLALVKMDDPIEKQREKFVSEARVIPLNMLTQKMNLIEAFKRASHAS